METHLHPFEVKGKYPKNLKSVWAICVQPFGGHVCTKGTNTKVCVEVTFYLVNLAQNHPSYFQNRKLRVWAVLSKLTGDCGKSEQKLCF